jgi:hypothetical protein
VAVYRRWLIVDSKGGCRIVSRDPSSHRSHLKADEIGYKITVTIPESRRQLIGGEINLKLPEAHPPIPTVEVEEYDLSPDDLKP